MGRSVTLSLQRRYPVKKEENVHVTMITMHHPIVSRHRIPWWRKHTILEGRPTKGTSAEASIAAGRGF